MEDFCINIKFNIPNIDKIYERGDNCPEVHHAHINLYPKPERKIILKVYYDDNTYLYQKLSRYKDQLKDSNELVQNIELTYAKSENIKNIDFSLSKWKKIKMSSSYYEGDQRYLLIELGSIKFEFKPQKKKEENTDWLYSEFYLNEASRKIIEYFYSYPGFGFSNNSVWEAHNRSNKYFMFGKAEIMLDFNFYYRRESDNQAHNIYSEPRLNIRHKDLNEDTLVGYCKLVCATMSIFRAEYVDFNFARIHKEDKTITISKIDSEVLSLSDSKDIQQLGFYGDFTDFLKAIQLSKIEDKINIYSKFSEKYVLAKKLDGESKFMIFYNLLEQIRNIYIDPKSLKQEYSFTTGKSKTGKIIRSKLRELVDIIQEDEKKDFSDNVITHSNSIKLLPMKNQFQGLFDLFSIDLTNQDLNFGDLVKIRNKIFHGHFIDSNDNELKKANDKLPILVGKIMVIMLGIE